MYRLMYLTTCFLIAVIQEINNFESSVVVHELEFEKHV